LSYELRLYFLRNLADRHAEWQGNAEAAA
jgi:hypothetical protein